MQARQKPTPKLYKPACKDPDALFSYPTLKRVLKKLGWKVGPKESDQSGKVGGQKKRLAGS